MSPERLDSVSDKPARALLDSQTGQKYLTVGQFAEMCELSAAMLRHYDRMGLLRPAAVDPGTRYRFYTDAQVRTAELIRLLRDVDVPLPEIAILLADLEGPQMQAVLQRQRERVAERRDAAVRILARLDRALNSTVGLMPIDVRLVKIQPQWVVSRRTHASIAGDVETVDLLLNDLVATARACGALSAEREFVFYYNPFRRRHGYDLEVCVPLTSRRARYVPGARRLPGGMAATLTHLGPWEDLHPVYVSLYAWIKEQDHDTAGAPRETYLVDDRDTDDPLEYVTRVDWLVKVGE